MMRKFTSLYESFISRYTRGGFLTGDIVKFKEGIKSENANMSNVKQCKNHCRLKIQGFLRNVNQRRVSRSLR